MSSAVPGTVTSHFLGGAAETFQRQCRRSRQGTYHRNAQQAPCPRPPKRHEARCGQARITPSQGRGEVEEQAEEAEGNSWNVLRSRFLRGGVAVGAALATAGLLPALPALGLEPAPQGSRRYADKLDGYTFVIPEDWVQVRGSNADAAFRNPAFLEEVLFVIPSSPTSSKYGSVTDLGTPEEAGEVLVRQLVQEFMSTRIGVRRPAELIAARQRTAEDGRVYYEVEVNVKSFVNSNQLGVMPGDRVPYMEWNRRYLSVLGVENKRLYELRLQSTEKYWEQRGPALQDIGDSFRVFTVSGYEGSAPLST